MKREMVRKKLLVSGCSFTEHTIDHDGIERRWCHYVADKLGYDLINLGKSGAGNEYIFASLFDYIENDPTDIGLVIPAWSKSSRRDYAVFGQWRNNRQDQFGDKEYFIKKTNRYKNMLDILCKVRNIDVFQIQMIEMYDKNFDCVQGHTIGFMQDYTPDFISDSDRHPSQIGHDKIGKYIYENL